MVLPREGRGQVALLVTLLLSAPASPAVAQEINRIRLIFFEENFELFATAIFVLKQMGA
jgi:hypothetical protein